MRATRGLILSTDEDGGGEWSLRPLRRELAPVANTPLIMLELQGLHDAGIREIGIVSDAGLATAARDAVGDAGLDVDLVHIDPPAEAGLAGRLLAAEPFIGDRPFVANMAGSLTQHDLGRSVERLVRKGLGALVVLAKSGKRTPQAIPLRGGDAQAAAGEPPIGEEAFAGANVFVFGSEAFDAARAAIEAQRNAQVDVTAVLDVLAEKPGHVQAVLPTGWSKSVKGVEDLLEINRLVLDALTPAEMPGESSGGNRIMGPVAVDETATIESSVLNGPLTIAADAYITDSYVGPYTAIGAMARIDGAEIERSVVFPAASIKSVGSRIEGSVIGVNARVTREFVPPRALRLWVGQDARVSLA
jgi:glucose-1-phosphate thymidylyltransferase